MSDLSPTMQSKAKFDTYAGMSAGEFPEGLVDMSLLQVELHRWEVKNFEGNTPENLFMGVAEELGELAHAMLKHNQKIRGLEDRDKYLEAAGDAIADMLVYMTQLATQLRLDIGILFEQTAVEVMKRDWTKNPENAHELTE